MSTLRSLLYQPGAKFQCNQSFVNSPYAPQGCTFIFQNHCSNTPDNSYNANCMQQWCVPQDIKCCVTFELIGGGGSGAGACCCQQGQPGGSGAYAVKTLLVPCNYCQSCGLVCCGPNLSAGSGCGTFNPQGNQIAQLQQGIMCNCQNVPGWTMPGCCYCMQVGYPAGCTVDCRGCQGCTTWVQGSGLCNLCAEGGFSGVTCCFTFWGNYPTYASQCCYYGSIYMTFNEQSCVCYYGADCGAPGKPGYLWTMCGCGSSCYWYQYVPFPGGLVNTGGGYMPQRTQGDACFHDWSRCVNPIGYPMEQGTDRTGFLPGQGGMSATSCGNPCCYGYPGGPGMIRITYR